ncbi:MAG: hypothetical protein ACR2OX_00005, partial [Methyloligellaceae bacterium]
MINPDVEPEGTREILDKLLTEAFFRPERLPGLQSLFEKVADTCSEKIAAFSRVEFQCTLTGVNTASAGRVFKVHEGQGVWVAVNAVEWDTRLLFAVDRNMISIILELFLGTDGAEPMFVPELPLSSVSSGILRIFAEYVSTALMDGFAKLSSTTMSVEEISAKIQPDSLGNPETPVVIANYGLSAMESEGTLSIIIPKSA